MILYMYFTIQYISYNTVCIIWYNIIINTLSYHTSIIFYNIVSYHVIQYYLASHYIWYCIISNGKTLHLIIWNNALRYHIPSLDAILIMLYYCIIWYNFFIITYVMVSLCLVSFYMILYCIIWYGMIWYYIVSSDMISYRIIYWYNIISYHIHLIQYPIV